MKQLIPNRIAEILFAIAMGVFGLLHFKGAGDEMFQKSVPAYLPGNPSIWIYISGAAFLLFALAILISKFKREACYALAVLMALFFIMVHLPDLMVHKYNLYQPLKDFAIAMAAIIIGNNSTK